MPTLDSPGTDFRATATGTGDFVKRWSASGAAERANYQLFLSELCDIVAVPRPDPTRADDRDNAYVFEKPVTFEGDATSSTGRIDLYKRGCFALEAKPGSDASANGDGPSLFTTLEPPPGNALKSCRLENRFQVDKFPRSGTGRASRGTQQLPL